MEGFLFSSDLPGDATDMCVDAWRVRATMCELIAASFRYPDTSLAEAVFSGEWAAAADEVAAAAGLDVAGQFAAADLAVAYDGSKPTDAAGMLHVLRTEATRLFYTPPTTLVSPYEGVWRASKNGVDPLLFVNPHSLEVERFCARCGLGRPAGTNEPLDHIATEFELLEYLAALEGGIATPSDGAPATTDLPGSSAAAAFEQFARDHVAVWCADFADAVARNTRVSFYRAASVLLMAAIAP